MKHLITNTLSIFLVYISAVDMYAQEAFEVEEFTLTVQGTSTLHDWEITSENLIASTELVFYNDTLKDITSLRVEIPVKALKSGKNLMDKKTYDALKAENFPIILYELANIDSAIFDRNISVILTQGNLTIAGSKQPIALPVIAYHTVDGIRFIGEKELLMSTFSIDPPTALMGTIKTGDKVKVKFEIQLSKHKKS